MKIMSPDTPKVIQKQWTKIKNVSGIVLNAIAVLTLAGLLLFAMNFDIAPTNNDDNNLGPESAGTTDGACTVENEATVCSADQFCFIAINEDEGICQLGCRDDNGCGIGQTCDAGVCIEDVNKPLCSEINPCPEGQTCDNGFCVVDAPPPNPLPGNPPDVPFIVPLGDGSIPNRSFYEGLFILQDDLGGDDVFTFANFTDPVVPTAFATDQDFVVIDLLDGEVLLDQFAEGVSFGVVGVTQAPGGPNIPAALLAFGPGMFGSFLTLYQPDEQAFGALGQLLGGGFDAYPIGGDVISPGIVYTRTTEIDFIVFDTPTDHYILSPETLPFSDFGNGSLVSAYGHTLNGPILAATSDPGAIQPGQLWLHNRDGQPATNIGALGIDTHKLRCIPPVCAASNFGADSVTIITWDGIGNPAIIGDIAVGSGPVGIDLTRLDNGNTAILSTSFNNNTIHETVVAPDGSEVASFQMDAPSSCQNPGHAAWLRDDAGLKIVTTCFTAGHYSVVASQAQPTNP